MEFFFIQMSDTQIGMSATLVGADNPKRAEMLARGLCPPLFEETEGFAFETGPLREGSGRGQQAQARLRGRHGRPGAGTLRR